MFLLCTLQVVFITEYMSSGSLKQFLKKTKKNHKTLKVGSLTCMILHQGEQRALTADSPGSGNTVLWDCGDGNAICVVQTLKRE